MFALQHFFLLEAQLFVEKVYEYFRLKILMQVLSPCDKDVLAEMKDCSLLPISYFLKLNKLKHSFT